MGVVGGEYFAALEVASVSPEEGGCEQVAGCLSPTPPRCVWSGRGAASRHYCITNDANANRGSHDLYTFKRHHRRATRDGSGNAWPFRARISSARQVRSLQFL
jgi:hypothetical protein